MDKSALLSGGFIGLTVTYAALSTVWVSSDPGWYSSLHKPNFQPPDIVFGLIWPLNFLALGVVGVMISQRAPARAVTILGVFFISVGFALAWAYFFYVPHQLGVAAIMLGVASVLTWVMVILTWRITPILGAGLLVYAAWLTIATALARAYAQLN
jgi:translocator protein